MYELEEKFIKLGKESFYRRSWDVATLCCTTKYLEEACFLSRGDMVDILNSEEYMDEDKEKINLEDLEFMLAVLEEHGMICKREVYVDTLALKTFGKNELEKIEVYKAHFKK